GDVKTVTQKARSSPMVRVMLLDESGALLGDSYAPVTPSRIPAGALGQFTTQIENPPFEAFELELQFAPESDAGPRTQSVADSSDATLRLPAGSAE
ncbi:MAG: hypothetical protein WA989_01670, partial [Henriciella sp.]|uniref:hypothetical protein n=1 Tax=Henriciella sp. TaxID=1968823 RepID=UPI003C791B39